jgi:hypothetical protein
VTNQLFDGNLEILRDCIATQSLDRSAPGTQQKLL